MARKILMLAVIVMVLVSMLIMPAQAATPAEIATSITNGLAWLAAQQNADGSWGWWLQVGYTGFAVVKMEDRAFELGFSSPFDAGYAYHTNVENGLNYIFSQAQTLALPGPTTGVYFSPMNEETYQTGIATMAIAASRAPTRVVAVPGSPVNGWTYQQVVQGLVDYFIASQNPDGGWRYWMSMSPSDNSVTGYATLGLRYAEAPLYGFSIPIPAALKAGLSNWVTAIQGADGGSQYTVGGGWENLLKTGNLLFEGAFVGDTAATPRMVNAIGYIQNHWLDANSDPGFRPHHYQSMYAMMKGFESLGIETITVAGNPVNWYDEFADIIVLSQNLDGSWPGDYWMGDPLLSTAWALLTLEKVAPPPQNPADLNPGSISISPRIAKPGDAITVSFKVKNQSDNPAGASNTGIAIVPAVGDPVVSMNVPTDALAPWSSRAGSGTLVLPAATALGKYKVVVTVDALHQVPETNENNNVGVYSYLTVTLPDLSIDSLSASPKTVKAGDSLTISFKVKNQSDLGAPVSSALVSVETSPAAVNVFVPVPALNPWGGWSGSATVTIPAGSTPGQQIVVRVVADALGAVAETDEGNNAKTWPYLIVAP